MHFLLLCWYITKHHHVEARKKCGKSPEFCREQDPYYYIYIVSCMYDNCSKGRIIKCNHASVIHFINVCMVSSTQYLTLENTIPKIGLSV